MVWTARLAAAAAAVALAGCNAANEPASNADANANATTGSGNAAAAQDAGAALSLVRLDCGTATITDFAKSFSDRPLYEPGPREIVDSCYVIRHGDDVLLWDTGFPAAWKGQSNDMGLGTATLSATIAEQLGQLQLTPADVDVVGISHMHDDHVGQAAEFANARLVIGRADFAQSAKDKDPFAAWRGQGKPVTLASGDVDVFGDGSVTAIHLPGHTPDHLALLVKLKSGPVLLSGDMYHATEARAKRGVPPFNTDRAQTLASMDKFEALAKRVGAKVIIQHEPADVAKLPAFPQAAN